MSKFVKFCVSSLHRLFYADGRLYEHSSPNGILLSVISSMAPPPSLLFEKRRNLRLPFIAQLSQRLYKSFSMEDMLTIANQQIRIGEAGNFLFYSKILTFLNIMTSQRERSLRGFLNGCWSWRMIFEDTEPVFVCLFFFSVSSRKFDLPLTLQQDVLITDLTG